MIFSSPAVTARDVGYGCVDRCWCVEDAGPGDEEKNGEILGDLHGCGCWVVKDGDVLWEIKKVCYVDGVVVDEDVDIDVGGGEYLGEL